MQTPSLSIQQLRNVHLEVRNGKFLIFACINIVMSSKYSFFPKYVTPGYPLSLEFLYPWKWLVTDVVQQKCEEIPDILHLIVRELFEDSKISTSKKRYKLSHVLDESRVIDVAFLRTMEIFGLSCATSEEILFSFKWLHPSALPISSWICKSNWV